MANRIKGITIELNGDATGLQDALKGVNGSLGNTQKALSDVTKLLKLDPKNTALVEQKQKLLADAVEQTWTDAAGQIKTVVNTVVFPALTMVLGIAFFVKVALCFFDYRKHGQFEWTGAAILFVCLIFVLLAPNYIWNIVGI